MNKIVKDKINKIFALVVIIIAFCAALMVMLKYKTEGETNMPFIINKILVVSSADTFSKSENPDNNKWNLDINQYNDIYIDIQKNNNYNKNAVIKSVLIENINVSNPKIGNVSVYMPNSDEQKMFMYDDMFLVKDSLKFNGAIDTNPKTLSIANQGGNILFRIVNRNVAEYVSNDDDEIAYDGTLLNKTNTNIEDLTFEVTFDIVIKTESTTYRGNKKIELPCKDLETQGVTKESFEDCSDIIFKREK